ncbi:hypothetical protein [Actinoplanes sp. DH11]|uniref:hypothetical protein n=1 Tax=Actinoplanes sp. DH11 TaxID=2857011 RepID=UPI001E4FF844|nr:hypothetical protein [Actinoplanes sp. DH11]
MTTTTPDPDHDRAGTLSGLFTDLLDLVDESIANLTDAQVEQRLHHALISCGYTPITSLADPLEHLVTDELDLPGGMPAFTEIGLCLEDVQLLLTAADAALLRARQLEDQAEQRKAAAAQDAETILRDACYQADQKAAMTVHEAQRKAAAIVAAAERDAAGILAQALGRAWTNDSWAVDVGQTPVLLLVEVVWPGDDAHDTTGAISELHTMASLPSVAPPSGADHSRSGDAQVPAGGIPLLVWSPSSVPSPQAPHRLPAPTDVGVTPAPLDAATTHSQCADGSFDTAPAAGFVVHTSALVLIEDMHAFTDDKNAEPAELHDDTAISGTAMACTVGAETLEVVDDNGHRVTEHLVAALTEQGHTAVVVRDRTGKRVMGCMVALIRRIRRPAEHRPAAGTDASWHPPSALGTTRQASQA